MKYADKKLGRKRLGTGPQRTYYRADKVRLLAKYSGYCALCDDPYNVGSAIMYDGNKEPGRKCVHVACYEIMQKNRLNRETREMDCE